MGLFLLANGEGAVGTQTAVDALRAGKSALESVEAGIRIVEKDSAVKTVGFGGAPNILGEMQFDASIMCGATRRVGAVGALENHLHAISVAHQVMKRTPHVMLVGEGAALFAAEIGETQGDVLHHDAKAEYEKWLRTHVPEEMLAQWPNVPLTEVLWPSANPETARGTTCFLARAADTNLAGGVSTSGWAYKYPGRLGDSPIIGAGMYVDNRYGAAACTHTGEMTIRACAAHTAIMHLKHGATAEEACRAALDDLRDLREGHLGPVVVHVVDPQMNVFVGSIGLEEQTPYWFWQEGMEVAECRRAVAL